jgi:BstXI restriction endonuclease
MARLPKLPKLLDRKIYKTGQTRGADDDEIFQNRVSRSSTVLIPYPVWTQHFTPAEWAAKFAKGYIVLISPTDYFGRFNKRAGRAKDGLTLGQNALVFYETRVEWIANDPSTLKLEASGKPP